MKVSSRSAALASILELLRDAEEMELKRRWRVSELLNHEHSARYFRSHRLIFVVVANSVMTVHHGTAKRWRKIR